MFLCCNVILCNQCQSMVTLENFSEFLLTILYETNISSLQRTWVHRAAVLRTMVTMVIALVQNTCWKALRCDINIGLIDKLEPRSRKNCSFYFEVSIIFSDVMILKHFFFCFYVNLYCFNECKDLSFLT